MTAPAQVTRKWAMAPLKYDRTFFNVFYSKSHQPGWAAQNILKDKFHPLRLRTQRRYQARDRDALWWQILCGTSISPKKVVRSWVNRRMKNAFTEALAARGLNSDGKPVAAKETLAASPHATSLTGSLRLLVKPNLVDAKYADLVESCTSLVDGLLGGNRPTTEYGILRPTFVQKQIAARPNSTKPRQHRQKPLAK